MQNQEFFNKEQVGELVDWLLSKVEKHFGELPKDLSDEYVGKIVDDWVTQNGIKTFNPFERFARKCSATGVGMNSGYVWSEGDEYFSTKEVLLARIKKYVEENNLFDEVDTFDDEELLEWAHGNYYCCEWEKEHMENGSYLADGTFISL